MGSIQKKEFFFEFDRIIKSASTYDSPECNVQETVSYFKHPETLQALKVFECLLENREVTIKRITELTQLTEQQVRKTLQDYNITKQNDYYYFIESFENTNLNKARLQSAFLDIRYASPQNTTYVMVLHHSNAGTLIIRPSMWGRYTLP